MGKRNDWIGLTVPADLTEASYDDADGLIIGQRIKQSSTALIDSGWYVLTVASQNMGTAMVMRMHYPFTIDVSGTYGPDEWSLTYNHMVKVDSLHKLESITVWSPGA